MRRPLLIAMLFCLVGTAPAAFGEPALIDPAEAMALLAGSEDDGKDSDRLLIFDRSSVDVEDSGLSHRIQHRLIKVLKPSGATALRALRFDFDPASNEVGIFAVRIHRADSTRVDIDTASAIDRQAPASMIYWGGRMLTLGLPRLAVGDGVEIISTMKGFLIAYLGDDEERFIPPMRGTFYDVVTFQGDLPCLEKSYTVRVPRDRPLQYSVYNGEVMSSLRYDADFYTYRFSLSDVPALKHESRMSDAQDIVPKVVMASVDDWEAKSRWFFETNEWVFDSTPEIDEKVREITRGLKGRDEKIAALLHWVAQNIRYSGLSMGKGEGYTIHPSEMTFRDRCGVCKDIAGILVTMLRSAGYETYPAMTMAGARVEDLPADQFNHCVVALKQDDGEYLMLDPTWAPWNNPLWSRWEGEQHYVIGSPDGDDLDMIPAFTPEDNLMMITSTGVIDAKGDFEGTLVFVGSGVADGRLRGTVADRPRRQLRAHLEGWLARLSEAAELIDFKISDHRDFTRDTRLELRYRLSGWAARRGEGLLLRSPALGLVAGFGGINRLAAVPVAKEREHPLFMWAPQEARISETLKLPRGSEITPPEDLDRSEKAGAARVKWETDGRKLSLSASATVGKRTIPVDEYAGLREVASDFKEAAKAEIFATAGRKKR